MSTTTHGRKKPTVSQKNVPQKSLNDIQLWAQKILEEIDRIYRVSVDKCLNADKRKEKTRVLSSVAASVETAILNIEQGFPDDAVRTLMGAESTLKFSPVLHEEEIGKMSVLKARARKVRIVLND